MKVQKQQLFLLIGCLGSLILAALCFMLPWIPFFQILQYPDSSHEPAKIPENSTIRTSRKFDAAVVSHPETQKLPQLPPSLERMQDLKGSEASSQIVQKIEALKNAEINISGVVVDELGSALQDVEVVWTLGYVYSNKRNTGSTKTNETGRFLISDLVSPTIHLTPYKKGYTAEGSSTGTWFADLPCSEELPLKLVMRKD